MKQNFDAYTSERWVIKALEPYPLDGHNSTFESIKILNCCFFLDEKGRDLGVDCTIGCTETPQVQEGRSKLVF